MISFTPGSKVIRSPMGPHGYVVVREVLSKTFIGNDGRVYYKNDYEYPWMYYERCNICDYNLYDPDYHEWVDDSDNWIVNCTDMIML